LPSLYLHANMRAAVGAFESLIIQGVVIMLYLPREEGQGLVEYALILVLVAVVVIIILAVLGPRVGNIFSRILSNL
jgi:pilus assembly protein Flp/PilA